MDALFIVVALGADTIEKLATCAEIEAEVEIMGGLEANEEGENRAETSRESIESTSK